MGEAEEESGEMPFNKGEITLAGGPFAAFSVSTICCTAPLAEALGVFAVKEVVAPEFCVAVVAFASAVTVA